MTGRFIFNLILKMDEKASDTPETEIPEIEIPENPTFEEAEELYEKLKTACEKLSWGEKLAFSKKNSPLFQKLSEIHDFCGKNGKKKKRGTERGSPSPENLEGCAKSFPFCIIAKF